MLDKSIPYQNIIMQLACDKNPCLSEPQLPAGFCFKTFQKNDEFRWAEIEYSVLEFESTEKAVSYLFKDYMPYLHELEKRCVFIVNPKGRYIATSMAWWIECNGKCHASIHWVAVHPDYHGQGFGKLVFKKALSLFPLYENNLDIYLHTQTWSYVAVEMYDDLGFWLSKSAKFGKMANDYAEAVEVLKPVLDEAVFLNLVNTAE
jgi:ribosomal protein S18 acetylase RimI-like enzyme